MQDQNRSPSQFSQRTEDLASVLGCQLGALPARIGISDRMFYGYRTGKYPISAKAWRKLEAAEKEAGISKDAEAAGDRFAVSDTNPDCHAPEKRSKEAADAAFFRDSTEAAREAARQAVASEIKGIQDFIRDLPISAVEARMKAADAWPPAGEDRDLSAASLFLKYNPKNSDPES